MTVCSANGTRDALSWTSSLHLWSSGCFRSKPPDSASDSKQSSISWCEHQSGPGLTGWSRFWRLTTRWRRREGESPREGGGHPLSPQIRLLPLSPFLLSRCANSQSPAQSGLNAASGTCYATCRRLVIETFYSFWFFVGFFF